MTISNSGPMVGRRNPGIRGDFDLLCRSFRTSALRSTLVADRRNGDAMIAEQLDDASPIAGHDALVRYLDSLDFDAESWVADFEDTADALADYSDDDEYDLAILAQVLGTDDPDDLAILAQVYGIRLMDDETVQRINNDQTDLIAEEAADAAHNACWGTVFDPEDLQWGFSVRTRF